MRLLLVVQEVLFVLVVYEKIDFSRPAPPPPPPDRVTSSLSYREREREGKKKKVLVQGLGFPAHMGGSCSTLGWNRALS